MAGVIAEGVDALLGARFLLVAPRTAKGRVEVVMAQGIEQRLRLQQTAAALGVEHDRVGARGDGRLIAPHQQLRAHMARYRVTEDEHLLEFESRVDVQQRKRNGRGVKRLLRQAQHH